MKKCSSFLIIKEMQVKTKRGYHLTPVRMAISQKSMKKKKCWWGYWEKRTLVHYWWECKLLQLVCKTVWRFLKRQKKLPYNPAIPLLSIYSKNRKLIWKDVRGNRQEGQESPNGGNRLQVSDIFSLSLKQQEETTSVIFFPFLYTNLKRGFS